MFWRNAQTLHIGEVSRYNFFTKGVHATTTPSGGSVGFGPSGGTPNALKYVKIRESSGDGSLKASK